MHLPALTELCQVDFTEFPKTAFTTKLSSGSARETPPGVNYHGIVSIINCKYKLLFVSFKSVEEVVKKPQKFTQRGCLMCAAILLRNAYKSGTLCRRACTSTHPHTTLCESHLRLLSCVAACQSGQSTSYVARFPDLFSRFTYSGGLYCPTTLSNDATLRCKAGQRPNDDLSSFWLLK